MGGLKLHTNLAQFHKQIEAVSDLPQGNLAHHDVVLGGGQFNFDCVVHGVLLEFEIWLGAQPPQMIPLLLVQDVDGASVKGVSAIDCSDANLG